jgi:hypothetical protein
VRILVHRLSRQYRATSFTPQSCDTMENSAQRKMTLHWLRKMRIEKKRVSAKHQMMHAALNSNFLYQALFSE